MNCDICGDVINSGNLYKNKHIKIHKSCITKMYCHVCCNQVSTKKAVINKGNIVHRKCEFKCVVCLEYGGKRDMVQNKYHWICGPAYKPHEWDAWWPKITNRHELFTNGHKLTIEMKSILRYTYWFLKQILPKDIIYLILPNIIKIGRIQNGIDTKYFDITYSNY